MAAKVFVSCGQATEEERSVARQIETLLRDLGYRPYVAIQVQTILDINSGIIEELRSSDLYLLVNFCREELRPNRYRGSLFSNQELAIAYTLGFERMLILNQEGLAREGLLSAMAANTPNFQKFEDVPGVLRDAIRNAQWTPEYTRQLKVVGLSSTTDVVTYADHTGHRHVRIFRVAVRNNRPDLASLHTVCRLVSVGSSSGKIPNSDRSALKVVAHPGYDQVIWPCSHGEFDIFGLEDPNRNSQMIPRVFLNSALDLSPRDPVISGPGEYQLDFEVLAHRFPRLDFSVELSLSENPLLSEANLITGSSRVCG